MNRYVLALLLLLLPCSLDAAHAAPAAQAAGSSNGFDGVADSALAAMRARADELKVSGVAVVAYFEGETIQSWSSKMVVVGSYRKEPKADDKGSNLLAVVYSKAAEMADTHKNSGSQVRPVMTGEVGWQGGVIAHGKTGYVIAAFSGGKSEDDVQVSQAGLAKLKAAL
jgi:hypothetical protein